MASLKFKLRKKANKDGTYAIALQIIKDRKASIVHVGHNVNKEDWDDIGQMVKKSHPNHTRLNNLLLKKKSEASSELLDLETKNEDHSPKIIKTQIRSRPKASFFDQAKIFTDNLKRNGKYNRYTTDIGRVERFREFLSGDDITFPEITVTKLNQFRAWLKSTRNISERTIVNYLLLIRTIYNQAANSKVTDKSNYPFGKDKIVIKFPDSIKIGLAAEEVKTLELLKLEGYEDHARNIWLMSLYFAGMRLSDVLRLKWSNFKDARLYYAMTKNLKAGSLKVPDKALSILNKYRSAEPKHDFVFPELKVLDELDPYEVQRKISYAAKRLDKALKKILKKAHINKNISLHIARHTLGWLAGDKISVQILQSLYRHSKITTTINYQGNFVNDKTDKALDSVLDF